MPKFDPDREWGGHMSPKLESLAKNLGFGGFAVVFGPACHMDVST